MRRLTIHIGWPKTGSSILQAALSRNQKSLLDRGILYPEVERWGESHHRACGLIVEHSDPLIPPPLGTLGQLLDHFDDELNRAASHIILSSEGFCRASNVSIEAKELLKQRFEVRILACLRPPVSWANSLLNEFAKSRLVIPEAVDLDALGAEMIERDTDYNRRLELWADAFGRESIIALPLQEDDDFLVRTLSVLDIDINDLKLPPSAELNASVSLGSLQLIAWLLRSGLVKDEVSRVAIFSRLKGFRAAEAPNLLSVELESRLRLAEPVISAQLSENWLSDIPIDLRSSPLGRRGKVADLDSPDILAIAETVFPDRPDLLRRLALAIGGGWRSRIRLLGRRLFG